MEPAEVFYPDHAYMCLPSLTCRDRERGDFQRALGLHEMTRKPSLLRFTVSVAILMSAISRGCVGLSRATCRYYTRHAVRGYRLHGPVRAPAPSAFACRGVRGDQPRPSGTMGEGSFLSKHRLGTRRASTATLAVGSVAESGVVEGLVHVEEGRPVGGSQQVRVWSYFEWQAKARAHRDRVLSLLGGSVKHDSTHPIANFLFGYYHFRPKALLEYSPGMHTLLQDASPDDPSLARRGLLVSGPLGSPRGVVWAPYGPKGGVSHKHEAALRLTLQILTNTLQRPPNFFCYGAHEWAMLYRPPHAVKEPIKYQSLPLRVSQEVLNEFVEGRPIRCTHFDAFRFFTPEAQPLNVLAPQMAQREAAQTALEQPGCLHANMDLFKWCLKLGPYCPSELVCEALGLAIACRVLDMRASPYDLTSWAAQAKASTGPALYDTSAVAIETPEGRAQYQREQQALARRAEPLRRQLVAHLTQYLDHIDTARQADPAMD